MYPLTCLAACLLIALQPAASAESSDALTAAQRATTGRTELAQTTVPVAQPGAALAAPGSARTPAHVAAEAQAALALPAVDWHFTPRRTHRSPRR